jgi:hypothetical protein
MSTIGDESPLQSGAPASQLVVQAAVVMTLLLFILWAGRKRRSFALAALVAFFVSYHA